MCSVGYVATHDSNGVGQCVRLANPESLNATSTEQPTTTAEPETTTHDDGVWNCDKYIPPPCSPLKVQQVQFRNVQDSSSVKNGDQVITTESSVTTTDQPLTINMQIAELSMSQYLCYD
jgi:hypothetical protein